MIQFSVLTGLNLCKNNQNHIRGEKEPVWRKGVLLSWQPCTGSPEISQKWPLIRGDNNGRVSPPSLDCVNCCGLRNWPNDFPGTWSGALSIHCNKTNGQESLRFSCNKTCSLFRLCLHLHYRKSHHVWVLLLQDSSYGQRSWGLWRELVCSLSLFLVLFSCCKMLS